MGKLRFILTQHNPEHQHVTEYGDDHDDREGSGPDVVGHDVVLVEAEVQSIQTKNGLINGINFKLCDYIHFNTFSS